MRLTTFFRKKSSYQTLPTILVIRYSRENESTGFSSKRRAVKSELNPDPRMSDYNRSRTYKPQVMQESAVSAGGLLLVTQGRETRPAYLRGKAACCPLVTL